MPHNYTVIQQYYDNPVLSKPTVIFSFYQLFHPIFFAGWWLRESVSRCMHIFKFHFLQLSRSGSAEAPTHQPIRSQLQCALTNERPGQFLLRGASEFLPSTQTRHSSREKAKVLLTYLYSLPENTFIKEPLFLGKRSERSVLSGCYPQTWGFIDLWKYTKDVSLRL